MHRRARGKVGGDEVGLWACGWPVKGPLRAALGSLNAHEWGEARQEKSACFEMEFDALRARVEVGKGA